LTTALAFVEVILPEVPGASTRYPRFSVVPRGFTEGSPRAY